VGLLKLFDGKAMMGGSQVGIRGCSQFKYVIKKVRLLCNIYGVSKKTSEPSSGGGGASGIFYLRAHVCLPIWALIREVEGFRLGPPQVGGKVRQGRINSKDQKPDGVNGTMRGVRFDRVGDPPFGFERGGKKGTL